MDMGHGTGAVTGRDGESKVIGGKRQTAGKNGERMSKRRGHVTPSERRDAVVGQVLCRKKHGEEAGRDGDGGRTD